MKAEWRQCIVRMRCFTIGGGPGHGAYKVAKQEFDGLDIVSLSSTATMSNSLMDELDGSECCTNHEGHG